VQFYRLRSLQSSPAERFTLRCLGLLWLAAFGLACLPGLGDVFGVFDLGGDFSAKAN